MYSSSNSPVRNPGARRSALCFVIPAALLAVACAEDDKPSMTETRVAPLVAVCLEVGTVPPASAWVCGEDAVVECDTLTGSHRGLIYVASWVDPASPEFLACVTDTVAVSDAGPFLVGEHTIVVVDTRLPASDAPLCTSELRVVDTAPPEVAPFSVELWPPNHQMVELSPYDCLTVHDHCDADVEVAFTWAASDESPDATGDGNTYTDIVLTALGVSVRAERSGNEDGRVYTLGWIAVDNVGNFTEGVCHAVVPHDQGGGSTFEGGDPAYTVVVLDPFEIGPLSVDASIVGGDAVIVVRSTDDEG